MISYQMNYTPADMHFARLPALALLLPALLAAPHLQAKPALETPATLSAAAARYLEDRAASQYPDLKARVEIAPPDPRLYLTRCNDLKFSLPTGNHPHGTGSLGLRCSNPQPWALYLSYRIRLTGPTAVAARPLAARQVLSPSDVAIKEFEFSQAPGNYLRTPEQVDGLQTRQPIAVGQPLLINQFNRPMAVRAGQKVRLIAETAGFSINHECTAMNNAAEGEGVRCKTPSGRIVQGVAAEAGTVRITP